LRVAETAPCNLSSSCSFKMRATNASPIIFCPLPETQNENGSYTTTTTFSAYDPDSALKSVTGSSPPGGAVALDSIHYTYKTKGSAKGVVFYKVINHCNTGTYNIQLTATDSVNTAAHCNLPITLQSYAPYFVNCPHSGDSVQAGFKFVSSSFSAYDLDGDSVSVLFLGITPSAINNPYTVGNHVEWMTTQIDTGRFDIQLQAIDQCGAKDTCNFFIYSRLKLPDFTLTASPETCCVSAGQSTSYQVILTSLFGFDNPCTLLVAGLTEPSDSQIFDDPILTPTDTTFLNVYTSTETDTGYYTLTIIAQEISGGKSPMIIHTTQIVLKVNESSDVQEITENPNNPRVFALFQNQPNPFNPETQIRYSLPRPDQVRLTIYNLLGQKVKTLFDGYQNAGIHSLIWDGKNNDGVPLSSGIYFYQLIAGNYEQTRKMVLMK